MITNNLNLPQPFVDAATSDYKPTEGRYSVTRVLGSPCEAVLLRRHGDELDGDVADYVWQIFGSAVHKVLEESKETDDQIKENFITVPILERNGKQYVLSGIFDLYDDSTGTVTDWKTCGVIKWQKKEFDDYRMQLLLYCWMLRKIGLNARKGEIVMLLRDWSKSKARFDKDYPDCQVKKIEFKFNDKHFEDAERYVNEWFKEVAIAESLPDERLTPCTPRQRWHRDDKWAVKKKGTKRAVRVLDSEDDADALAKQLSDKNGKPYCVEYRKGEDVKCEMYCSVVRWCPYGKNLL